MSIIYNRAVADAGAHDGIGSVDVTVTAHDAEHGNASVSVRTDSGNSSTYTHLSPKAARKIAFALAAAAHAVEQSALVKSNGGEIEGRKLMDAQEVGAEVRA